jgi:hypothetical protein
VSDLIGPKQAKVVTGRIEDADRIARIHGWSVPGWSGSILAMVVGADLVLELIPLRGAGGDWWIVVPESFGLFAVLSAAAGYYLLSSSPAVVERAASPAAMVVTKQAVTQIGGPSDRPHRRIRSARRCRLEIHMTGRATMKRERRIDTCVMRSLSVVPVLFLAMACAGTPTGPLENGTWGGTGIALTVTETGAALEFDCATGSISGRIIVTDQGFSLPGIFVLEHGGPVHENEPPDVRQATYTGRLSGSVMQLDIVLEDGTRIGPYEVRRDRSAVLRKCA